ncbi:MAG TPA: 50S ribosomal protein L18 [Fimbriimonadaceae bacterium]|nr:50S ribosomal protein L18 [Fimbriimonadaceae bacterium]HRJ96573.1 50S ribosomal protein L18 [Fimbriimonadaceae bacterium]
MPTKNRSELRIVRHKRVRKKVDGASDRPRLAVFRSLKHISAQVIDDQTGTTLAAASSQEKDLKAAGNAEGAKKVGEALAKRCKDKGIARVVFDRGGFRYHGRVAKLAEGAREGGLEF